MSDETTVPAVIPPRTVTARIEDLMEIAALLGKTSLVAGEKAQSQEDLALKVSLGRTLGLPDAIAVSGIMVVNGNPSVWGKAKLGIVQASGFFDWSAFAVSCRYQPAARLDAKGALIEVQDLVATVKLGRVGGGSVEVEFGWGDACTAGLNTKDTYKKYPKDMLIPKALNRGLDLLFSDVLKGVGSTEDALDVEYARIPEPESGPLSLPTPRGKKAKPAIEEPVEVASPYEMPEHPMTESIAKEYPDVPRVFISDRCYDHSRGKAEVLFHDIAPLVERDIMNMKEKANAVQ
jgi:hypothetical protein